MGSRDAANPVYRERVLLPAAKDATCLRFHCAFSAKATSFSQVAAFFLPIKFEI